MHEENMYDIVKLNQDGSKWFYGVKTMNDNCGVSAYLGEKQLYENRNCFGFTDRGRGVFNYK